MEQHNGLVSIYPGESQAQSFSIRILRKQFETVPGEQFEMFLVLPHCCANVKNNFLVIQYLHRIQKGNSVIHLVLHVLLRLDYLSSQMSN